MKQRFFVILKDGSDWSVWAKNKRDAKNTVINGGGRQVGQYFKTFKQIRVEAACKSR